MFIIHEEEYDSVLQSVFKTEFLSLLVKHYQQKTQKKLPLKFNNLSVDPGPSPRFPRHVLILFLSSRLEFKVKKGAWGPFSSSGSRQIQFRSAQGDEAVLKPSGKVLQVSIGPGLPKNSSKVALTSFLTGEATPPHRVCSAGPTRRDKRKSRYLGPQARPSNQAAAGPRERAAGRRPSARGSLLRQQSSMEQPSLPRLQSQTRRENRPPHSHDMGFMAVPEQGAAG